MHLYNPEIQTALVSKRRHAFEQQNCKQDARGTCNELSEGKPKELLVKIGTQRVHAASAPIAMC